MATRASSFGSILPLNGGAGSSLEACSRFRPACWPVIAASSGSLRAGVIVLVSVFAWDSTRLLTAHSFNAKIDGTAFYAKDPANGRMMEYLAWAPRGVVLEKLYDDERPNDTGIYGSFAQKPNLIGIPWVLRVWKRNLTELPALMSQINSFFAGTHPQASRFLRDNGIRYVVWSAREGKDLEKWRSIMASIEADYRWMEFSDDPNSHIGLWIRR